jgi:hypothetical protein
VTVAVDRADEQRVGVVPARLPGSIKKSVMRPHAQRVHSVIAHLC